mmetsp:Transcript_17547/g.31661  ORF Transcript_17547/g.31661 Transcript_17547/m.31661 type:complete len:215 (-) Transcript_17547:169-813(-)
MHPPGIRSSNSFLAVQTHAETTIDLREWLRLVAFEQSFDFDHALFLQLQGSPHAFNFVVIALNGDFVFRVLVISHQFDFALVKTIAGPPIINTSIGRYQHKVKPIGAKGQFHILKLNLQHQRQTGHSQGRTKGQKESLTGTLRYQPLKGNRLSRFHHFVIIRLHIRHDFPSLLPQIFSSFNRLSGTDKGLAFGLGSGTALNLTPQPGKAQCIKA